MTSTDLNGTNDAGNNLAELMKSLDDHTGDMDMTFLNQILKDFDVNDMNIDDILNESSVRQIILELLKNDAIQV